MYFADRKTLMDVAKKIKDKYPSLQIRIDETDNTLSLRSELFGINLVGYNFVTDMIIIDHIKSEIDIDNMLNIIKVQKIFVESLK